MTVPFLMNCPHNDDSWCLACTKELGEENWTLKALISTAVAALDAGVKVSPGSVLHDEMRSAIKASE